MYCRFTGSTTTFRAAIHRFSASSDLNGAPAQ